ncbi:hypothetical protein PLICRDRAFT_110617 [Plicaturopsis crispa FD-325 SS-3]|nr:hypothetical protein PLICRDRAFT_110617 [Plicaturopsis crispa FD-325 SS-3]
MDHTTDTHEQLFSRGATPPQPRNNPNYPQVHSHNSSPNQLESLFHNLSAPSSLPHLTGPGGSSAFIHSDPGTPVSFQSEDAPSSSISAPNNTATERQSALLNLLGTVSSPPANRAAPIQQIPTPPISSSVNRASHSPTGPNTNESQGKYLLEQLMSGNAPRSNYTEPVPPAAGSSPQHDVQDYHSREGSYGSPREAPRPPPQQPSPKVQQQQQQQPPSPTRKSMFDFISPFDAFPSSTTVKKKPVPSVSSGNEDSWSTVSAPTDPNPNPLPNPKHRSVENLMEQLTRPPQEQPQPAYDPYDELIPGPVGDRAAPAPPPPLPPKPPRAASPRGSPPKTQVQHRAGPAQRESPVGQLVPTRRDKDSSPGPRGGNWKGSEGRKSGKGKNQGSPTYQAQTVVFDVSQDLLEIQSPLDSVKATAIALVKQDSVFLPGTTIGVTQWVAYAMTKGRVRVISRLSGDRTLLQLPPTFPPSTSVTDMAVFGNRLAGVTSDGGFVVWELPPVIMDDVPGKLLLCVAPSRDADGLHSVKWHPKELDTLAVASESRIYLLDLAHAAAVFRGEPIVQSDLTHLGPVFAISSRLIAFDFDISHLAIASICEDSTLALWNVRDKIPFWTHKVRGDDIPSSLTFVEDGIVVGRKNGTIFQVLSPSTKNVVSTVKFVNGNREDPDMFGHVNYDARIQTLWVANSRRESIIALKLGYDNPEYGRSAFIDQVVEFAGLKPTIHFVILSADSDPTGEEAHAACVAAKVPPGELALVSFSVHSSGVDQILIRREWFDNALATNIAKLPPYSQAVAAIEQKPQRSLPPPPGHSFFPSQNRARTPPSDEGLALVLAPEPEPEALRDEGRLTESKGRNTKTKNVGWKDKEDSGKDNKLAKISDKDAALINESALGQAMSREIRKSEENLHTRLGRLIGKEMDKQHSRLEEARTREQADDFARQEKILKLISTELTRNTTRVVEMAVKAEVQNSVLPSLENITKNEVKAALNDQVGRGLSTYIQQSLPIEIEKLLLRPDISAHFAHILSSNLTPLLDRHVKEAVHKSILPVLTQQSAQMHQELLREVRSEVLGVKNDMTSWQSDAFRSQETLIRDLEHSVRTLSEQVKFVTMNATGGSAPVHHQLQQTRGSPTTNPAQHQQSHLRQANHPPPPPPSNYNQGHNSFQQQPPPPPMQGPAPMQGQWYPSSIAAPQASHPLAPPPPPPPPVAQHSPPTQPEEWDDTYLAVLGSQDSRQLRELLSRSNPEVVMPLNGPSPLSQAVILTLLHRLSAAVGENSPADEAFKTSLWWLQRTVSVLNPNDPLISAYVARVVPNVQAMLNTTKQRLSIIPGGPQLLDTVRTISDVQETLSRK